jgi:superfamily II DNA or RNA helicase
MQLKIENTYSWLLGDNPDIRLKLWTALRFRDKNYFHSPAYKNRLWDGYVEFFKKDSGRFLSGLLPEVRAALKFYGVEFTEDDRRLPLQIVTQPVDENWLPGVKLRDYQVENINMAIANQRGLVYAPTSAGKTLVVVGCLKTLPPTTPTIVLCNRKGLVDQNYEEIKAMGFDRVGRIYDSVCQPDIITCLTWQSWAKFQDKAKYVRAMLVDEIHDMMSDGVKKVYRELVNCNFRIGLSATPFKFGGADKKQKYETKGFIGPVFKIKSEPDGKLTTKGLQNRNILSSAEAVFHEYVGPELPPYLTYIDAVTHGIAENADFHDTVSQLARAQTGRTLVIVERIKQGDELLDRLPDALWVRGQDSLKTRKMVIERLKTDKGNLVAIATAGIFNTGINVFCHNLINAAGGQADHTIIQRFGRGLRRASDKKGLKYFDFLFRNNEYLEKHSQKRIRILEGEGHTVQVKPPFDYMS